MRYVSSAIIVSLLSTGCATTGPTDQNSAATAPQALPSPIPLHPAAIVSVNWKVGDSCVYQVQYGSRKSMHTRTVTNISGGRISFSDKGDDGSTGEVVQDGGGTLQVRGISLANRRQITLDPPNRWLDLPLQPGKAWMTKTAMTGRRFQADLRETFEAGGWESVRVPAGEFAAIKVQVTDSFNGVSRGLYFKGTGNWAYWIAADTKCPVKFEYKNSFADESSRQLMSYKEGP
jgi:hypothetical protein